MDKNPFLSVGVDKNPFLSRLPFLERLYNVETGVIVEAGSSSQRCPRSPRDRGIGADCVSNSSYPRFDHCTNIRGVVGSANR